MAITKKDITDALLEYHYGVLEPVLNMLVNRMGGVEGRMESLEGRMDGLGRRFEEMGRKMDLVAESALEVRSNHEERIRELEGVVGVVPKVRLRR